MIQPRDECSITAYEEELILSISQIRKDMDHVCRYLNEKSIIDDSISKSLRRIAEAMEDGKH